MIGQQPEEVYAKMLDFIKKHSSNQGYSAEHETNNKE